MRVIIDSNQVIQRDWFLSGPAFQELLRASERGHIELIIPQIVFDEISNKYRESILDIQRNLRKVSRDIDHLHISLELELDDNRVDEESARYETQFRETINQHKVKLAPYPDVSHEIVARRALDRRKPFDAKGHKGYRDTLVWTSVLEAASDSEVTLITDNWSDFGQGKDATDKLAEDLLQDLLAAGHGDARVRLSLSVGAFAKSWIEPAAQLQQELQDRLDADVTLRNDLETLLASEIEDRTDLAIDPDTEPLGEIVEILPESVIAFHMLSIQDVRKFAENEYLVAIYTEADVDIVITYRIDMGSWRMEPGVLESKTISTTVGFEFDASYRDARFTDVQLTYPKSF